MHFYKYKEINNNLIPKKIMTQNKKKEYTTPKIKVVSFLIEKGFAGSVTDDDALENVREGTNLNNTNGLTRWQ